MHFVPHGSHIPVVKVSQRDQNANFSMLTNQPFSVWHESIEIAAAQFAVQAVRRVK
jgi:hypothetical protein